MGQNLLKNFNEFWKDWQSRRTDSSIETTSHKARRNFSLSKFHRLLLTTGGAHN